MTYEASLDQGQNPGEQPRYNNETLMGYHLRLREEYRVARPANNIDSGLSKIVQENMIPSQAN